MTHDPEELMRRSYQGRVLAWLIECFGEDDGLSPVMRRARFLEEAFELAQALGGTEEEAVTLARYVHARPPGEPTQEVGGVYLTLAGLCASLTIDMEKAGEAEYRRVLTRIEIIRAKHAARPLFGSPLPGPSPEEQPEPAPRPRHSSLFGYCDCPHPMIKCDNRGCRCVHCGLPRRITPGGPDIRDNGDPNGEN